MPHEEIRVALDLSDAVALIEIQQQEIATLKIERDLLKKHQAVCECGGFSIDHNLSDNHQVSDMLLLCPFSEQITALTESRDEWKRQWRLMEAAEKKAEEQIAALTKQIETHKRLNTKYPHGASGCCCLFDDEENPISWCKPHADLRDENLRLMEEIATLKAENTALTEQRKRMGTEYDDLDEKLKNVQSIAAGEIQDYAKTVERLNKLTATLIEERNELKKQLEVRMETVLFSNRERERLTAALKAETERINTEYSDLYGDPHDRQGYDFCTDTREGGMQRHNGLEPDDKGAFVFYDDAMQGIAALEAEGERLRGEAAAWEKSHGIEWDKAERLTIENERLREAFREQLRIEPPVYTWTGHDLKLLEIAKAALKEVADES